MSRIYASNVQSVLHPFEDAQLSANLAQTSEKVDAAIASVSEKLAPARSTLDTLASLVPEHSEMLGAIEQRACRINAVRIHYSTAELGAGTVNMGANEHTVGLLIGTRMTSFYIRKNYFYMLPKTNVQREEQTRLIRVYPSGYLGTDQPLAYRFFWITYGGTDYSAWQVRWSTGYVCRNLAAQNVQTFANQMVPAYIWRLDAYPITED